MFSGEGNLVYYCFQDKEGALLYLGERERCSTVYRRRDLVLYCSQEKETGELLFSGEGNMFSIVFRRREHVHYCYQEKETGALMFQEKGSATLQTAVLKEKETSALLLMFSGEGDWCSLLYCSRAKGDGAVLIGFYRFYLYKTLIFICLSRQKISYR